MAEIEAATSDLDVLLRRTQQVKREFVSFDLSKTVSKASESISKISNEFNNLNSVLKSGFEKTISNACDVFLSKGGDAKDLVNQLERDLLKFGGQYFKSNSSAGALTNSLSAIGSNVFSNFFPGFATGGSFTVGGAAGHDRNLVGLRLSRGERVDISTPAQQRQQQQTGNSSPVINLNYNIQTPDATSFRRSQSQIQAEALRNAQRLMKRNG